MDVTKTSPFMTKSMESTATKKRGTQNREGPQDLKKMHEEV